MKNKYLFLIICCIGILFSSCSETGLEGPEGPVGPIGPAGPQGVAGNAGAVGAAGKDGSIMYSGTGVPTNTIGANGDYYLDKNTGNLYGPKTLGVWGTPIVLRGADGTNGTNGTNGINGNATLSGSGTPSLSTGIVGDYFLDKTNYLLYGPKTASSWGIPILLRGADGTQGPMGPAGADGSIMYSGSGVPVATIGKNGDYYLDKTTGDLYGPKTASGWGTPLVLKGTNGVNGTNGSVILSGNGVPVTSIGVLGDYYLDKTNYLLYGPKDNTGWGIPILLRGANGAQGPMGPAGADGTVIYSGETAPDASLGKIGDFYVSRLPMMWYGPKSMLGWGLGTNLKGTDGTNGNGILNGTGAPANTLGTNGDFYIDTNTYTIYGPKASGVWGAGTPLAGSGGGNSSNLLFETPDNATFDWGYEYSYGFDLINLKMHRNGSYNDSTSVFQVPTSAVATAQNSIMLIYMRDVNNGWKQVVEGDTTQTGIYSKARITSTTASARIIERKNGVYISPSINKVRIVLVPYTNSGVIGNVNANNELPLIPMKQMMQKLNITDKDFKKLR